MSEDQKDDEPQQLQVLQQEQPQDAPNNPPITYPMHLRPRTRAAALSSRAAGANNTLASGAAGATAATATATANENSESRGSLRNSTKGKSIFANLLRKSAQSEGNLYASTSLASAGAASVATIEEMKPFDENREAIQTAVRNMSSTVGKRKSLTAIILSPKSAGQSSMFTPFSSKSDGTFCRTCQKIFKKLVSPRNQCSLCKDWFCKACIFPCAEVHPNPKGSSKACGQCLEIMQDPQEVFEKSFDKEDPEIIIRCLVYLNDHQSRRTTRQKKPHGDNEEEESKSKEDMAEFVILQGLEKRVMTLKEEMLQVHEFVNPKYASLTLRALFQRIERLLGFVKLQFESMYDRMTSNDEWMLIIRSAQLRIALVNEDALNLKEAVLALSKLKIPNNPYIAPEVFELTWEVVDAQLPPDQRLKRKDNN